jgi:predicted DNA-binding protein with PD1-like motif
MRQLRQPGPPHPERTESYRTTLRGLRLTLQPGRTLQEAVCGPLSDAGFQSASLRFAGGSFSPFRYVMPALPDDSAHVAYFSAACAPDGVVRIEHAAATFGWSDGSALLHCHAAWLTDDGQRQGGHLLPDHCVVESPIEVDVWGSDDIRIASRADAETNFTLLQPIGDPAASGPDVIARIRPNQDLVLATETVARRHGIREAMIVGTLGSLVGACFVEGETVDDIATEILVTQGTIRGGVAELDVLAVDMRGMVHGGRLARGNNAVCITADLMLRSG